jgi:anti-sigma B factor antagonist
MHNMRLQVHQLPKASVVHVDGAIEANTFPGLLHVLNHLLTKPIPQVILDCGQVPYVGTAELKGLLDLAHRARARGGDIKCAGLAPTIEQVATLIANGDPLECFPDVIEALAQFRLVTVAA